MQARAGTEQARRHAGHKPSSEAIDADTHLVMTDFDIKAFRLQDSGYDAQQIRDIRRQMHSGLSALPGRAKPQVCIPQASRSTSGLGKESERLGSGSRGSH